MKPFNSGLNSNYLKKSFILIAIKERFFSIGNMVLVPYYYRPTGTQWVILPLSHQPPLLPRTFPRIYFRLGRPGSIAVFFPVLHLEDDSTHDIININSRPLGLQESVQLPVCYRTTNNSRIIFSPFVLKLLPCICRMKSREWNALCRFYSNLLYLCPSSQNI